MDAGLRSAFSAVDETQEAAATRIVLQKCGVETATQNAAIIASFPREYGDGKLENGMSFFPAVAYIQLDELLAVNNPKYTDVEVVTLTAFTNDPATPNRLNFSDGSTGEMMAMPEGEEPYIQLISMAVEAHLEKICDEEIGMTLSGLERRYSDVIREKSQYIVGQKGQYYVTQVMKSIEDEALKLAAQISLQTQNPNAP